MLLFIITLISSRFPLQRSFLVPLAAIIITTLCMATTCPRDEQEQPKYVFHEKFDLLPAQKAYNLGDTIWVEYDNPNKMFFDTLSGQSVPVDSVRLTLWFRYTNRYNGPDSPATGYSDFIQPGPSSGIPATYRGYSTFPFHFGCTPTDPYKFRVGFVPKYTGIFSLDISSQTYLNDCPSRVKAFPYSEVYYSFNVIDANKDVYLTIPPANRRDSTWTLRDIDRKKIYVFAVQ